MGVVTHALYCREYDSVVSTPSSFVIDVVAITMSFSSFGVPFVVQTEQEIHFAQNPSEEAWARRHVQLRPSSRKPTAGACEGESRSSSGPT